jgi:endonuclease/exonuclease/phosphatase family metal-dependent hydrolase
MDGVLDLERIAGLIRDLQPDLVALQEIDQGVERTRRERQSDLLAAATGLAGEFGAFMDYQGGEYGMAVLSRWPIAGAVNHRLPEGAEPRSALAIRVRSPTTGRELEFVGIHFYRTEEERLAQAQALEAALEEVDHPVVLAGDFNSTPGSAVMQHLDQGWTRVSKSGSGFTFPADGPEREIDFVLVRGASVEVLEERVVVERVASDHRPVWVRMVVR